MSKMIHRIGLSVVAVMLLSVSMTVVGAAETSIQDLQGKDAPAGAVWLDTQDMSSVALGWGSVGAGKSVAGIKNIAWSQLSASEPPLNLPIAADIEEADKQEINFMARTEYKNKVTTFGIKKKDRRRHVYVIGKSGTGKSTLIGTYSFFFSMAPW